MDFSLGFQTGCMIEKIKLIIRDSPDILPEFIEVLNKIKEVITSNPNILNNEKFISMVEFIINDSGVFIKN